MARIAPEVLPENQADVAPSPKPKTHSELVADKVARGEITGLLTGVEAMKACGAQSEFIAHNILQAQSLRSPLILRAGDPPQYNKDRSPKSGVNLSKTSKQGFFKGALSRELRFARLEADRTPKPHHAKDTAHLALPPTDPDYQHTMHLDISMHDILREVGPGGDLEVLGFNEDNGQLRLGYKDGHGPSPESFNGQFIVNLYIGSNGPQFYSRPWDRPEASPDWDSDKEVITKPAALSMIPDDIYEEVFNSTFKVNYTETKDPSPAIADMKRCEVFANRPRDAESFKATVDMIATKNPGTNWPKIKKLIEDELDAKNKTIQDVSLADILTLLKTKAEILEQIAEMGPLPGAVVDDSFGWTFDPDMVIRGVYDVAGSIVAGDWDGMALGHPPGIKEAYKEVHNTFAPPPDGLRNMNTLMRTSNAYLADIKAEALAKPSAERTAFENKALSIERMEDIVSDFALARAGCITPHEFLYQQVLNDAYRDEANKHYGADYSAEKLQSAMDTLLRQHYVEDYHPAGQKARVERVLAQVLRDGAPSTDPLPVPQDIFDKMASHLNKHLTKAILEEKRAYKLPHVDYDMNVRNLFQHGFDMRNPYGSNLEGPWLLVNPDGGVLYGDTQEQLIEVMLTGDFLKDSLIDVSHGADMSVGWDRVIAKQLELGQAVPDKTLSKYNAHRVAKALAAREPLPEDIKLTETNLDQFDMSHGWDKLLPQLLANDYVVDYNLAEKCEAYTALQTVNSGGTLDAPVRASADSMKYGWDKVIKALIEKDQIDQIEPETLSAYETHAGVTVTQPIDAARATL